jgi:hypothetical protein
MDFDKGIKMMCLLCICGCLLLFIAVCCWALLFDFCAAMWLYCSILLSTATIACCTTDPAYCPIICCCIPLQALLLWGCFAAAAAS